MSQPPDKPWPFPWPRSQQRANHIAGNRAINVRRRGNGKLRDGDVPLVRRLVRQGVPRPEVARMFGVSLSLVHSIMCGAKKAWVPDD